MKGTDLVALVKAHVQGDGVGFQTQAAKLAQSERRQGHSIVANQILDALENQAPSPMKGGPSIPSKTSLPPPSPDDHWIMEYPEVTLDDLVLDDAVLKGLLSIRDDLVMSGRLAALGFDQAPRALFHGSPGTGKTHAAQSLATSSGRPIMVVSLDTLVSSYLGETAQRLASVFDAAKKHGAILFLDELDSIGRERDDSRETGELKRVVIALLQLLDRTQTSVPVIAATNHAASLDRAIWRRFLDHVHFTLPDERGRIEIFESVMPANTHLSGDCLDALGHATTDWSGAELLTLARHSAREAVRRNGDEITEQDVQQALSLMASRRLAFSSRDAAENHNRKSSRMLAKRNEKICKSYESGKLTQAEIGKTFNIRQPQVSKIIARHRRANSAA